MTEVSLTGRFRDQAARLGARDAVVFSPEPGDATADRRLSYAGLDRRARQMAALLQARFAPGDRILLVHNTGLGFVVSFLGCVYAGLVAVPVPAALGNARQRDRLAGIARNCAAAGVSTDPDLLAEVSAWAAELPGPLPCVAPGDDLPPPDDWRPVPADPRTIAFLQYTSGSTGSPKGVVVDHGNVLTNAETFRRTLGVSGATRFGGWLPLYHDFGLIGLILVPLCLGATTVLMSPMTFIKRPHTWLRLIDRHRVMLSPAPNFAYELCTRRIRDEQLDGIDLAHWRWALNGSEPVQAGTVQAFTRRFGPFGLRPEALSPGYGLAEATLCVTSGDADRETAVATVDAGELGRDRFVVRATADLSTRAVVSCGTPRHVELRIVDPASGEPLPAGRIGEIWIRGRDVARGYWNAPAETAATFEAVTADGAAGYLRTGDLGTLHNGELYVTGRIKEVIISNGVKLYPQDIEAHARLVHPGLAAGVGAVFTVPAPDGEIVVLHEARLTGLDGPATAAVAASIARSLGRDFGIAVPNVVLVRPGAVPRTSSGKIQRGRARELLLAGRLTALHATLSSALSRAIAGAEPAPSRPVPVGGRP